MCCVIKFVKLLLMINEGDDKDEISTSKDKINLIFFNLINLTAHTINQSVSSQHFEREMTLTLILLKANLQNYKANLQCISMNEIRVTVRHYEATNHRCIHVFMSIFDCFIQREFDVTRCST